MAEPFHMQALKPVPPAERRNNKTINRDLSTMSTVGRHLATTAWKPKTHKEIVLDFAGATFAIK